MGAGNVENGKDADPSEGRLVWIFPWIIHMVLGLLTSPGSGPPYRVLPKEREAAYVK
jgi:hypothetical protein